MDACARPTFAALSFVLSVVLSDVAVCMRMCACTMDPALVDIIAQIIAARNYVSYYVGYVLSEVR